MKLMTGLRITEPIFLDFLAQEIGFDKKTLYRWNPGYDLFEFGSYPTPYYILHIPKDKLEAFLAKRDLLIKNSKAYYTQIK